MNIEKKEQGKHPYVKAAYMHVPCMQFQSAPCLESAAGKAICRRNDGNVVIDPEKAVGQWQLIDSCPYGATFWNEEKNWLKNVNLVFTVYKRAFCRVVFKPARQRPSHSATWIVPKARFPN